MEEIDFDQVATLLADLSQPSEMPKIVWSQQASAPFDASDVDFTTSAWLARVLEVGAWLNLDSTFEEDASPQEVALKLFDELSPDKVDVSFDFSEGHVMLTEVGAATLEARLSQAVSNREQFLQSIEDDVSLVAATEDWIEAWNEEPPTEPLSINATVDKWRIQDFAGYAKRKKLDLNPSYQRDYVWSNAASQMLIESILRGIPLPSIILAKSSQDQNFQIVDGKQRLTAILRFMGAHPDGVEIAKELKDFDLFETDFAKFAKRNNLRASDINEKYLPFKTKKYQDEKDPLNRIGGRYYCDIKEETVEIAGENITVEDLFERTCNYWLPVLVYNDTQVRDIHKVFRIYNQQGMKLNAEEIRNAVFNHLTISRLMLYVGGDRPEVEVIPELAEAEIGVTTAHENIAALNISKKRFRRTKVLFWTIATLFLKPSQAKDGAYRTPSTAKHIDEFLGAIDDKRLGQFQDAETLEILATDLIAALELHQLAVATEAWHPRFRRKGKSVMASNWEDLPVVASLLACLILVISGQSAKLEDGAEEVRDLTSKMIGPENTQNRTQWAHIANASISILETVGIDFSDAHSAVQNRYGSSAIEALLEIRKIPIT